MLIRDAFHLPLTSFIVALQALDDAEIDLLVIAAGIQVL